VSNTRLTADSQSNRIARRTFHQILQYNILHYETTERFYRSGAGAELFLAAGFHRGGLNQKEVVADTVRINTH